MGARGSKVETVELTRRFRSHVAVDRVSLTIEPGESFGLLGANGAGKTTFIRLITGYLLPTAGEVRVDGFSPVTEAAQVRARLGFVAETSRLYPDLRVEGFLRFVGGARGLRGKALATRVEHALERFALEPVARRMVGNLSKGYQQRVSLAQAFLDEPTLLIADEPTGGLDPLQQEEVRDVLARLRGERTVLLCTHDLAEARALCTRVAVMNRGRLAALGPTEEVLDGDASLALFRSDAEAAPA
ncbi:MAG: ABC transporter ATP-binding protein [Deltaproteobacteria bacterium]|nr:MAG: ABC transporter ATP-binding protein [Deltaproteobacteria bacterium]